MLIKIHNSRAICNNNKMVVLPKNKENEKSQAFGCW